MPSAVPVMHFASIDNGLVRGIDTQHEVPRNFWPQQEVIIVNVTNDNIKELVRIGYVPPSHILVAYANSSSFVDISMQAQKKATDAVPHELLSSCNDPQNEDSPWKVETHHGLCYHIHAKPREG